MGLRRGRRGRGPPGKRCGTRALRNSCFSRCLCLPIMVFIDERRNQVWVLGYTLFEYQPLTPRFNQRRSCRDAEMLRCTPQQKRHDAIRSASAGRLTLDRRVLYSAYISQLQYDSIIAHVQESTLRMRARLLKGKE